MQFKLVYENAQDGTIRGSIENIPTNDDKVLCNREDLENKGLVYETRDEKDGLVIMTSEDHLPGGDDDCQAYPMVANETPDPDPNPEEGGTGDDNGDGDDEGNDNGDEGDDAGDAEIPKVEE